eukprot:9866817-Heterocapsa_arctica.AAC.1
MEDQSANNQEANTIGNTTTGHDQRADTEDNQNNMDHTLADDQRTRDNLVRREPTEEHQEVDSISSEAFSPAVAQHQEVPNAAGPLLRPRIIPMSYQECMDCPRYRAIQDSKGRVHRHCCSGCKYDTHTR